MSETCFADPAAARRLLDEIGAPVDLRRRLTARLADLPDPDRGLLRLARIVAGQPPALWQPELDRLARLAALAPGLADLLIARPALLPHLLAGRLAAEPLPAALYAQPAAEAVAACRRWVNDARLGLGAGIIAGLRDPATTGPDYTQIAEAAIAALLAAVEARFRCLHGTVKGARFAVLALGKLGGAEMTAGSDLDLVLVADVDDLQRPSSGPKPLGAQVYYSRLANALLAALTERQGAETLYEIDVRLSPWARKSAATVHFDGFRRYYAADAWTWERMALTRARPIAGDPGLRAELAGFIAAELRRRRDPARLVRDVDEMRQRVARHHAPEPPFDAKHRPGGLVDCEFMLQYLMLREAWRSPGVLATSSAEAARRLVAAGALSGPEGATLAGGLRLWSVLSCLSRLTAGVADVAGRRLAVLELAGIADAALLDGTAAEVRGLYDRLVGGPAAAYG